MDEVTEDDWDFQVDTNLKTMFFLCRRAANARCDQGRGVGSARSARKGSGRGGFGGSVVYATSKGDCWCQIVHQYGFVAECG